MSARQLDIGSANPRMQCRECGRWMRLHGKDGAGNQTTRFYGGCSATNGDHPCGGDVCSDCCPEKCRARLGCDCQHPETTPDGFAAISEACPIHNAEGPTLSTCGPSYPVGREELAACNAEIPDSKNLCTRDAGHPGEHRCLAIDVDRRAERNA